MSEVIDDPDVDEIPLSSDEDFIDEMGPTDEEPEEEENEQTDPN